MFVTNHPSLPMWPSIKQRQWIKCDIGLSILLDMWSRGKCFFKKFNISKSWHFKYFWHFVIFTWKNVGQLLYMIFFNELLHNICKNHKDFSLWWNLAKFIKNKHPTKGKKKKQGARTKVQTSKQHKKVESQGGKGTTKYQNPHQSLEAYLKEKGSKPNEPSPIVATHLEIEAAYAFFIVFGSTLIEHKISLGISKNKTFTSIGIPFSKLPLVFFYLVWYMVGTH